MRLCSGAFVVLMFLCGAVVGGLTDHWWLQRSSVRASVSWNESRSHVIEKIKDELSLSAEQTQQLETILDDAMRDFNDLHDKAHHVRLDSMERIRAILNEEQKRKFEAARAKLQRELGQ